jgi:hypothetical protein
MNFLKQELLRYLKKRVRIVPIFFVFPSFFSCDHIENMAHLENGLSEYRKLRKMNEILVEGYTVKTIAFFDDKDNTRQMVLKLGDNVSSEVVEKYSLGIHAYSEKALKLESRGFFIWDVKPELSRIGDHKYLIVNTKSSISQADSIIFFLYDRDKFRQVKGNRIRIKNVKF